MVTAEMYARFLKEQKIKEKRRIEKDATEKKYIEEIQKKEEKRELEKRLAAGLDAKSETGYIDIDTAWRSLWQEFNRT